MKKTERWNPTVNGFRLCSDHFISGEKSDNPLSPDYVPSVFMHVPSAVIEKGKLIMKTFIRRQAAHRRKYLQQTEGLLGSNTVKLSSRPSKKNRRQQTDRDIEATCDIDSIKAHIHFLKMEVQVLRAENLLQKEKKPKIESSLHNNDTQVLLLTGLPTFSVLMALFRVISAHLKLKSTLTPFQQFVVTLVKLRMNLSFGTLASYFGTDSTAVSDTFKYCVGVMFWRLVPSLVVWPERKLLRKTLPDAFRNKSFERTTCIIGCFEVLVENQSDPLARAQCYATYKSDHTMKYLIAVSPHGSVSFISDGWPGRTSEKHITDNCDFLTRVLPGDLVLTDKDFKYTADLKTPAFTYGGKHLVPVQLESVCSLESIRIHIEQIIGVVGEKYTFLQSIVPVQFTDREHDVDAMFLDKIVKVCCALTNV